MQYNVMLGFFTSLQIDIKEVTISFPSFENVNFATQDPLPTRIHIIGRLIPDDMEMKT